ncbi:hypothetical protein GCM10010446_68780 [Streptomyces enissocaesilis]|uniref:Uncharacterized protein n=1 Tax=Streptomyces enissocaesilis TaxID=332589 RepID=A0ABN3XQY5_9ACTN
MADQAVVRSDQVTGRVRGEKGRTVLGLLTLVAGGSLRSRSSVRVVARSERRWFAPERRPVRQTHRNADTPSLPPPRPAPPRPGRFSCAPDRFRTPATFRDLPAKRSWHPVGRDIGTP